MTGQQKIELGRRLRVLREEKLGMTQAVLAAEIGVDQSVVSRVESGAQLPSIAYLVGMSRVCELPVDALVD
jgi:transcriptional regulator with XRE-family HTH domain